MTTRKEAIRNRMIAIGTVAALGGTVVGVAAANQVRKDNHHHAVVEELSQPIDKIREGIRKGEINPTDIIDIHVADAGLPINVARQLRPGHDPRELAGIISEQTGGSEVYSGEELMLPQDEFPAGQTPSGS